MNSMVLSGLHLSSSAFKDGSPIPKLYTQQGQNISPPLSWSGVPKSTKSFALIVEDPDAVKGTFTHWLLYNLPSEINELSADVPVGTPLINGALQGENSRGQHGYIGPNPPYGLHRYFFYLYAVDRVLKLPQGADRAALDHALHGHIVAEGRIMGTYAHEPSSDKKSSH